MPSPIYNNPLPDCLFMKLHCEPINPTVGNPLLSVPFIKEIYKNKSAIVKRYNLKLTLRFGEQTELFRIGSIAFGLKGGRLRLKLTNAKLLLETVKLTPKFSTDILVETVEEKAKEGGGGLEVKLTGGITANHKTLNKTATKYQSLASQVSLQGTEEDAVWHFQTQANNYVLWGIIQEEFIGVLEIIDEYPKIEAFFEFQDEDIQLRRGTGMITADIGSMSTDMIERNLILERIRSKIGSNSNIMSKAEVAYD